MKLHQFCMRLRLIALTLEEWSYLNLAHLHGLKKAHLYKYLVLETKINYGLCAASCLCIISNAFVSPALAKKIIPTPSLTLPRKIKDDKSLCLNQDLQTLTPQLLRDLPGYANRVTQRARRRSRSTEVYSYMLTAGNPEFAPLSLQPGREALDASAKATKGVEQVFFTTLSRQYIEKKAVKFQEFHWLFLTKTKTGWRMVMMFSQTGSYPKQKPPTPPRESSNGVVAQGIETWLRDCRAGTIKF